MRALGNIIMIILVLSALPLAYADSIIINQCRMIERCESGCPLPEISPSQCRSLFGYFYTIQTGNKSYTDYCFTNMPDSISGFCWIIKQVF